MLKKKIRTCNVFSLSLYRKRGVVLLSMFFFLFLFPACSKLKKEELKSYEKIHTLASIFSKIETKEDIHRFSSQIKRAFVDLVDLIEEFQHEKIAVSHPTLEKENEKLLFQMKRVYEIEGAKDLIEEYQKMALFKLDKFISTRCNN